MAEASSRGALSTSQIRGHIREVLPGQDADRCDPDRITELELRLREQEEATKIREVELTAMERDLVVKEDYGRRLELDQHALTVELSQVRERAAELFGDLERAEERITELEGIVACARSQASYRLGGRLAGLLERAAPLARLARSAARRLLGS